MNKKSYLMHAYVTAITEDHLVAIFAIRLEKSKNALFYEQIFRQMYKS